MDKHIKILSYLFIGFSAFAFIACFFIFLIFAGIMSFVSIQEQSADPMFVVGGIGFVFMTIILIATLPGFIAGIGLLKSKPWGRALAIIMAIIFLVAVPVGTIIGIYALWVLLNDEAKISLNKV